jgi:hypothetical protein
MVQGIATTDGYEEGLLPTYSLANFLRRFNRNLRQERPDAALLGMMGASRLLTEFPLPDDLGPGYGPPEIWSQTNLRTYPINAAEDGIASWHSGQNLERLRDWLRLVDAVSAGYARAVERLPMGQAPVALPTVSGTPLPPVQSSSPNSLRIAHPATSGTLLVRMNGYPGWRVAFGGGVVRRHEGPVMTVDISAHDTHGSVAQTRLVFQPYSFLLGQFVGLTALMFAGLMLFRMRLPGIKQRAPQLRA